MNDEDVKKFLDDFKKADVQKKMDMWFYALMQVDVWDEIMDQMSKIARIQLMKQGKTVAAVEE